MLFQHGRCHLSWQPTICPEIYLEAPGANMQISFGKPGNEILRRRLPMRTPFSGMFDSNSFVWRES